MTANGGGGGGSGRSGGGGARPPQLKKQTRVKSVSNSFSSDRHRGHSKTRFVEKHFRAASIVDRHSPIAHSSSISVAATATAATAISVRFGVRCSLAARLNGCPFKSSVAGDRAAPSALCARASRPKTTFRGFFTLRVVWWCEKREANPRLPASVRESGPQTFADRGRIRFDNRVAGIGGVRAADVDDDDDDG